MDRPNVLYYILRAQQMNILPENASQTMPFSSGSYIVDMGPPRNAEVPMVMQPPRYINMYS